MNHPLGKIFLVGAGPGDPELITVKGIRVLQQADVVLTDRLVSADIIKNYVPSKAHVIYVGKQCRKKSSTPQYVINALMLQYARQGKCVVRLKGGDVSVFSNSLSELEILIENHIPYEIVPGITAALGAAAYAGIPLTARNYTNAVRFLTAYQSDAIPESYWKELAQTDDTLVFYMSSETLEQIVHNLIANGISSEKKLAVIEQATTPFQKVYTGDIYTYFEKWGKTLKPKSPSLIIIGKVVALHQQFKWFRAYAEEGEYFDTCEIEINHKRNVIAFNNIS